MDAISRDLQKPVPWTLLYAADVMLASEDKGELERELQAWCDRLERSIKVSGIELPRTSVFKYLGSAVASDGGLMTEANSRVSAAWPKWRSLTGLLCDRKMPEHLKSNIYRAVVRPVAMYGAECWPVTKEVETRLSVMETKMLRWTAGVTRMDRIRNDAIRQKFGVAPIADKSHAHGPHPKRCYSAEKFGVAPIADKMREARLRWYGHVLRGREDSVGKRGLNFEVMGNRPRGRPKQRWSDTLHMDMNVTGIHLNLALDRERWRHDTRIADHATKRDRR
ncbi:unnamed protein product [Heligmosomoides polygyrus]|uniref:Reverse transcriptase domain-containing protein n=1 Tax=Heligmosomoides polygyrus TaxID=6339 RepID=A0A183GU23_HELPZ|nr:unnamed protein product [Heligmosomoides polygyrus]